MTGHGLDMWSGTRTFHRDLARYFTGYDGSCGDRWESIFIPVMDMISDGRRVVPVEIDYVHPAEQTKLETGDPYFDKKRLEQLDVLTYALEYYWHR